MGSVPGAGSGSHSRAGSWCAQGQKAAAAQKGAAGQTERAGSSTPAQRLNAECLAGLGRLAVGGGRQARAAGGRREAGAPGTAAVRGTWSLTAGQRGPKDQGNRREQAGEQPESWGLGDAARGRPGGQQAPAGSVSCSRGGRQAQSLLRDALPRTWETAVGSAHQVGAGVGQAGGSSHLKVVT